MPSHASAEKRVRKTAKRTAINKNRKSQIRTAVRKVEEALASGNREAATAALKAAEPQIMRGASKGVIHKNSFAPERTAEETEGLNPSPRPRSQWRAVI
jgi:small subunit ribosomal protein S20